MLIAVLSVCSSADGRHFAIPMRITVPSLLRGARCDSGKGAARDRPAQLADAAALLGVWGVAWPSLESQYSCARVGELIVGRDWAKESWWPTDPAGSGRICRRVEVG